MRHLYSSYKYLLNLIFKQTINKYKYAVVAVLRNQITYAINAKLIYVIIATVTFILLALYLCIQSQSYQ